MILKEDNGQLLVKDDAGLLGARTFNLSRPAETGITYCNYVPVQLTEEEWEKRRKKERAGKKYATVKLSNGNPHHRGKRGHILDSGNGKSLLEIETVNSTSSNGCHTLMGVVYPHGYEKIWFDNSELEKFEEYDENGDLTHEDRHI